MTEDNDNILEYSFGSQYGPNAPLGVYKLTILSSGSPNAVLEHDTMGAVKKWTAVIDEDTKTKIWEALKKANFPSYELKPIPPDSTMRDLIVERSVMNLGSGKDMVAIPWHDADNLPGYKETFEILDFIVNKISGNDSQTANILPENALTDIKQA
jgi:hypothetical protein